MCGIVCRHDHQRATPVRGMLVDHVIFCDGIGGLVFDTLVVGGIGVGAFVKLNMAWTAVFKVLKESVPENLDLLFQKQLPEFTVNEGSGFLYTRTNGTPEE